MNLRRFWMVFGVLVLGSLLQQGWYWQQLPNRVAIHFGIDGNPDRWMPKTEATLLVLALQIGLPFLLMVMGAFAERRPETWFTLPHQEHWLSPENRAKTIEVMGRTMAWIAIVTGIFMAALAHLVFMANESQVELDWRAFVPLVVVYITAVLALALRNYRYFAKKPELASATESTVGS